MHGTGQDRGEGLSGRTARSEPNPARLIARAAALVAELSTCLVALGGVTLDPPLPVAGIAEPAALSTKAAAKLLGVTPYTVNEWARLGRIRCRQDTPGGRRYWYAADLAAYEAEHQGARFAEGILQRYSSGDETQRSSRPSAQARANPTPTGVGPPRHPQHGRPVGTRKARRRPAGDGRPYAPGAHAWHTSKEPES